jgi:hypothetical protein
VLAVNVIEECPRISITIQLQIIGEPTTSERTGRTYLKVTDVRRLPSSQPVASGSAEDIPF